MKRPFRKTDRVILEAPLIIVEILSPDDRMRDTMKRFREYESIGVPHIIQMDPEDRTTLIYVSGDLVRRDLTSIDIPGADALPFDTRELLSRLPE